MDEYGRPFGAVFNLHKDYSKLFVGGFPTTARIQEVIRATNMDGQIEGFKIGGKAVGLWNYKHSANLKGAPERNKLKEQPERGLRFDGQSYLKVDRSNYNPNFAREFYVKLTFKPENTNGILAFIGDDKAGSDYAAVELQNGYLVYSVNLGSGSVSLSSTAELGLNAWHTVEITREGRLSKVTIDGEYAGDVEAAGDMDELDVNNDFYLGGYPSGQMPVQDVSEVNFRGCIEEFYLGPDRVDLSVTSPGAFGVSPGCSEGETNLVSFPAASPGYMHLNSLDLTNTIELTFMFRTNQRRALLLYMHDTPGSFYYISLILKDGSLNLNVYPDFTLASSKEGEKPTQYNDGKWHSVSILIQQSVISLHIDDYENFKFVFIFF